MYFDNLGGRSLVTISEFEINTFKQAPKGVGTFLNKHLLTGQKSITPDPSSDSGPGSKKVFVWKINVFNMRSSRAYDTVISIEDLIKYYEMEHLMKQ